MYFRTISVIERLPENGKWVTTIDEAGEHRVYRFTEGAWNMRDADGVNSPNNNLPIMYWLEQVPEVTDGTTFIERLTKEKVELDEKIDKLDTFVRCDKANQLDPHHYHLLKLQWELMCKYSSILYARLALLKKP